MFRRAQLDNGYIELSVTSTHAAGVTNLPSYDKDPFARLLLAQATVEGIPPVTHDRAMARNLVSPVRLEQ